MTTRNNTSETPRYRERVEVYARSPKGRLLSGLYPEDKSIGVYGGGIDPGEDPVTAAEREFAEETGRRVRNLRLLDVEPLAQPWIGYDVSPKQRERAKQFPGGHKTYFLTGELGRRIPSIKNIDTETRFGDVRLRSLQDALKLQETAAKTMQDPHVATRLQRRLEVLQQLRDLGQKTAFIQLTSSIQKEAFAYPAAKYVLKGLQAGPIGRFVNKALEPGLRWLEQRTERQALERLQEALRGAVSGTYPGTIRLPSGQDLSVKTLQELGLELPATLKVSQQKIARAYQPEPSAADSSSRPYETWTYLPGQPPKHEFVMPWRKGAPLQQAYRTPKGHMAPPGAIPHFDATTGALQGFTYRISPNAEGWISGKVAEAHRLSRRMTFRGLQISVETDKGEKRHWHDPHEHKSGTTLMKHPYGYIRRTEGVDGDHVDVYVGPNEDAKNVYVVHQMKAPDFKKFDEDKCMLGFDNLEEAKKAYLAHYDKPGFLGSITTMPFEEFKEKVMKTYDHPKKIAEAVALVKQGLMRGIHRVPSAVERILPQAGKTVTQAGATAGQTTAGPAAGRMFDDIMQEARRRGSTQAAQNLGLLQGPWG